VDEPYPRLDRPPLSAVALRRELLVPEGLYTAVDYRATTGSTNADAVAAARGGAVEGLVVVADEQTSGRGRLERAWSSPPRAGIAATVLLRPGEAVPDRGWPAIPLSGYAHLPLLAGVATVEALRRVAEVDAALKWPNDVLIDGRKCAGILAETVPGPAGVPPAVVVGTGLNVTLRGPELPRADATSLLLAGASCVDREALLSGVLHGFAGWYARWRAAAGDPVRSGLIDTYRFHCATIGAKVQLSLPGGSEIVDEVTGVADDGSLLLAGRAVAAGDVIHLRQN